MSTKPPRPFFWFPYLIALAVIVAFAVWPVIFFFQPGMDFQDGMYAVMILIPLWLPTTIMALVGFLVWLVVLLTHRRADREWLASHDA